MGKKLQNKNKFHQNHHQQQNLNNQQNKKKLLSNQKRNELNQLVESLLKIGCKNFTNNTELWSQYTEILEILNKIQLIENLLKIKVPKTNRTAHIDSFTDWCKNNGADFDGLKISEFPAYDLGLQAVNQFTKGDRICNIPKIMIMSEETLSNSLTKIFHDIPMFEAMPNVKLAFGLLLEKLNADSFWKPYIDLLPEKYSTVLYFNLNEMQELKGSNCLNSALNQCKSIARQYAFLYKCIQNKKNDEGSPLIENLKEKFTYDMYRWAVSTVMTRQNSIPISFSDGDKNVTDSIPALIPLWDMINHKDGENSSAYNIELHRLESFAFNDFSKGEQIFMYYGHRSNAELLVHNGFIYLENAKDSVSIRLGLGNHDELYDDKSKLLDQLHIANNCELKVLKSPEFISPHLLGFVRIFNMNKDQLDHWLNSERASDLLHIDCALETSLETKTWIFLQTRLNLLLRVFPTTLEEDEFVLSNHVKGQAKIGHIKAMLLNYRILEKRILLNALDYATQRTKP